MEIAQIVVAVVFGVTLCLCLVMIVRSFIAKESIARDKRISDLERDLENYRFLFIQLREKGHFDSVSFPVEKKEAVQCDLQEN